MKQSLIVSAATALLAFVAGNAAAAESGGIAVRRWDPDLSGRIRSDVAGSVGTRLDFSRDLGVDDPEGNLEFEGWFRFRETRLRATFYELDCRGSATLAQGATFDGISFPAGQQVDSRFRWDVRQLDLEARFGGQESLAKESGFGMDLILGARHVEFDGRMRSASAQAAIRENGFLPHAGLGAEFEITLVHGAARVLWGNGGYGHIRGRTREERYSAGLHFAGIYGDIGYRRLRLDVSAGDGLMNATFEGMFLDLSLRF